MEMYLKPLLDMEYVIFAHFIYLVIAVLHSDTGVCCVNTCHLNMPGQF